MEFGGRVFKQRGVSTPTFIGGVLISECYPFLHGIVFIVEVFEHDRTDGSRYTEMADVGGTLHENFQSISSAAEDC